MAVTYQEIIAMAKAPAINIEERRIRASVAFWFLSGIRIGAFVTLPISAINLNDLSVNQFPSQGVKTKNSKHATTYLLNIPELLDIVKAWDKEVRENSNGDNLWFAPLSVETGLIEKTPRAVGNNRGSRARKSLKIWLDKVGLPYKKPHSFRHGHAVYGIQRSKDLSDLKAISSNLMHKNLQVNDGVYGIFSNIDIKEKITNLGNNIGNANLDKDDLLLEIKKLIEQVNQK